MNLIFLSFGNFFFYTKCFVNYVANRMQMDLLKGNLLVQINALSYFWFLIVFLFSLYKVKLHVFLNLLWKVFGVIFLPKRDHCCNI